MVARKFGAARSYLRGDLLFGVAAPTAAVMAKRVCFRIQRCGAGSEARPGNHYAPKCRGAPRAPLGALPRIAPRAPQLRPHHRARSSYDEEEYSHGSDGEDDDTDFDSKCRVKRRSNGAPKPTNKRSTTEWVEEENAALRRCARGALHTERRRSHGVMRTNFRADRPGRAAQLRRVDARGRGRQAPVGRYR